MTQPHGIPEVHWIKHQVTDTHIELICDGEPLLGPHKIPMTSA